MIRAAELEGRRRMLAATNAQGPRQECIAPERAAPENTGRKQRARAESAQKPCSRCKAQRDTLVPNRTEKFEFIATANKNPARGSGRTQFLSFNLTNALICAVASSASR